MKSVIYSIGVTPCKYDAWLFDKLIENNIYGTYSGKQYFTSR